MAPDWSSTATRHSLTRCRLLRTAQDRRCRDCGRRPPQTPSTSTTRRLKRILTVDVLGPVRARRPPPPGRRRSGADRRSGHPPRPHRRQPMIRDLVQLHLRTQAAGRRSPVTNPAGRAGPVGRRHQATAGGARTVTMPASSSEFRPTRSFNRAARRAARPPRANSVPPGPRPRSTRPEHTLVHNNLKLRHTSRLIVDAATRNARVQTPDAPPPIGPSLDDMIGWLNAAESQPSPAPSHQPARSSPRRSGSLSISPAVR